MTSVPTALPVVVSRDPDSDTLRRQLARGPVVVVSNRPQLAEEIAEAADYPWALVPPDIGEAALQSVLGAVGAGFTVVPMALARVGRVSRVGQVSQVSQVGRVSQQVGQVSQVGRVSQVSQVGRVSQVSQVGQVGRVLQVSQVGQDDAPVPVERLTRRERDVLQCLAEGLANRAIARALGISEHTVKFHLASIFGKLGATTRTEAVRLGLRQGLVAI